MKSDHFDIIKIAFSLVPGALNYRVLMRLFAAFAAVLFFAGTGKALANDRPYYTDIGQFNYARFLLNEGDYKKASREFSRFIESFPGSPFIEEAQLRLSEAYLKAGLYRHAEEELKLFFSNYPGGRFSVEAIKMVVEAERRLADELPRIELKEEPPVVIPDENIRLRAVQVMFFEGKSLEEVAGELKRLKEAGVDTVIFRAFHNSNDRFHPFSKPADKRGVYFTTAQAPTVDDILPDVIRAAHAEGIRVFAWMTTRYADYGAEDDTDLACKGYDINTKAFVRCKGMDLFNERAVKRLEAIYSDLAEYEIDGVLFQDDLVLRHNEGFGPYMAERFKRDTGKSLVPEALYIKGENGKVYYTELFWRWASWKNRRLLDVAGRLKETVRRKRPEAKFAINLMYESLTNPPYALAWLSQDLGEAKKAGFDYYSIMAYHRQMEDELKKAPYQIRAIIEKMVEDAADKVGEPERVLIKVQTIDWKTGAPLTYSEVVSLINGIKAKSGVSLAVVPYRGDFPFTALGESMAYINN